MLSRCSSYSKELIESGEVSLLAVGRLPFPQTRRCACGFALLDTREYLSVSCQRTFSLVSVPKNTKSIPIAPFCWCLPQVHLELFPIHAAAALHSAHPLASLHV
jgi:hypothetical protein